MDKFIDNIFKGIDDNIKFDDNQKKIIKYTNGNLMVIAGAGAGKTTTMSAKVNFMTKYLKIPSSEILLISFTNKAVKEIDEYVNNKMNLNIDIFTFHKLAKNIIEEEGIRFNLINDDEKIIRLLIKNKNNDKVIKFLWKKNKAYKLFNSGLSNNETLVRYTAENIKLIKSKMIDLNSIYQQDIYLNFIKNIINELDEYKEKNNIMNFDDLIYKATKLMEKNPFKYKYVIIDEYQDISKLRYKFVKTIQNKSTIIVVGDDWQSIYSFAGSDVNLFLQFSEDFDAKKMIINNTYRNSKELIDIAGNFIMKDKKMIRKDLISNKKLINSINYIKSSKLEEAIKYIIKKYGVKKNILILGRFKNDINILNNNFKIKGEDIAYIFNSKVKIKFLTIHSSKGLGFDNVIILNNENTEYGFPPKIKNDYFKSKYIYSDNILEEERRLFYVALTRTKNEVLLVYTQKKSSFLKEIKTEVKKLKI